jgi:hypothetical protein
MPFGRRLTTGPTGQQSRKLTKLSALGRRREFAAIGGLAAAVVPAVMERKGVELEAELAGVPIRLITARWSESQAKPVGTGGFTTASACHRWSATIAK